MSSSPPLVGPEVALSPADEKMVELAAEATAETFAPIFRQFVAQLRRSASPGPRPRPPARPPAAFFSPEGGGADPVPRRSTEGPEKAALELAVAARDTDISALRATTARLESDLLAQKKANLTMKFNVGEVRSVL